MKLIQKIVLSGEIEILTGLHIGGSSTNMNIGETDLNVIKSPHNGQPIIPGSSLKGKLRNLLAKLEGSDDIKKDSNTINKIFGSPNANEVIDGIKSQGITRLIIRDAFLSNADKLEGWEMENKYTEVKWENTIVRTKGSAEHPRQLERVPKGARFFYEMILDVYDEDKDERYLEEIKKAMNLLEDDYLGGSGTRGYGKIKFHQNEDQTKTVESYVFY
jgi:CRISPR-associated protein Csm3